MTKDRSCIIVGAGVAGLTAAGFLEARGWTIVLLDKGHHVGGRIATRQIGVNRFDHGAQFFTVRDPAFRAEVSRWESSNWVTNWYTEGGHIRYRGVGGMRALAQNLASPFDVRSGVTVQTVEHADDGWRVITNAGIFSAKALLLTPPAPQSLGLLKSCEGRLPSQLVSTLRSVQFDSCFALMVTMEGPARVPPPGYLRPDHGPIEWIADNTQKGVSTAATTPLTIHSRADFSHNHLDRPQEEIARLLLEAAEPYLDGPASAWELHFWKYSRPVHSDQRPDHLFTTQPAPLAIAGDAFGAPRIGGAFLSGLAAAQSLHGNL